MSPIEVNDDKLHAILIPPVQIHGAASLPLGIESAFAGHENVIRLAASGAVFQVFVDDERTVVAVARTIEPWIQAQFSAAASGIATLKKQRAGIVKAVPLFMSVP